MGRKILFITTDQQRYDALGCNGGQVARTPVVDAGYAWGLVDLYDEGRQLVATATQRARLRFFRHIMRWSGR